jgi:hypothetical protein
MKILRSGNPLVRSAGLILLGAAILFAAWSLSYRALPERIVEGKAAVYYVPIRTDETATTFIRIFLWNLAVGCVPIALANLISVRGIPFGYALSSYHWAMYGVLLGTNSFIVPGPERFIPDIATLLNGTGVYEITAYALIASATFYLHQHEERKRAKTSRWSALKPSRGEAAFIVLAVAMLAASNYLEAWRMFH